MLGEGSDATATSRALARAEEAVDAVLRLLPDAEAVHWTGPGAAAYRCRLQDATDDVRRSRAQLREAVVAVAEHEAARRAGLGGVPDAGLGWLDPRWLTLPQPPGTSPSLPTASWGTAAS